MSKKKEPVGVGGELINGLPQSNNKSSFSLNIEDNKLKISERIVKILKKNEILQVFWLDLDKIISIDLITQDNIEEKQKSVVGRGIAGAVLFGQVGAIIGTASGINTEKTIKKTGVLVVSYYGADEEDIKTINFNISEFGLPYAKDFIIYYQNNYVKNKLEQNENGDIIL